MTTGHRQSHQLTPLRELTSEAPRRADGSKDCLAEVVFVLGSFLLSGLFFLFVLY